MTDLIETYTEEIELGLKHLDYSYKKAQKLSTNSKELDVEELEVWESFVARFSRLTDVFIAKYIRLKILETDPGYRGTLRDYLDMAEKQSIISSADHWMQVRELRNKAAHEYTRDDLSKVFSDVLKHPKLKVLPEVNRCLKNIGNHPKYKSLKILCIS